MAGGMGMGSILGMMGSVPVTKSQDVIINKLKAAKTLEAGDTSGVMNNNMMGGLQNLMKSPASKGGSKANDSSAKAAGDLSGLTHAEGTKDAIEQALMPAINDVVAEAGEQVGIGDDPQGLISLISSSNTLSTLSLANPDAYGLQVLLGPALADEELYRIAAEVEQVAWDVAHGLMTDNDGSNAVDAMASQLLLIIQRSQDLRDLAEAQSVYLASVSALSGLLSGGPEEWRTVVTRALYDEPLAAIMEANREFLSVE